MDLNPVDDVEGEVPDVTGGMTSSTLLQIVARVGEISLPDLVKAVRVPPDVLLRFLKTLIDQKLILVEGAGSFDDIKREVESLGVGVQHYRDTATVDGVPAFVIQERRLLLERMPENLKRQRFNISRSGFSRAYQL
jgi:hypothetical protein